MSKIVRQYADGTIIDFDRGKIDDWGVHMTCYNVPRHRPRDTDYFSELLGFAVKYGADRVYVDFTTMYDRCTKELDLNVLDSIDGISERYGTDQLKINKLFSILYATMFAEENRKNTHLGKRIKRLGIHQMLFEGFTIERAANYSKGMSWRDIDSECLKRGF